MTRPRFAAALWCRPCSCLCEQASTTFRRVALLRLRDSSCGARASAKKGNSVTFLEICLQALDVQSVRDLIVRRIRLVTWCTVDFLGLLALANRDVVLRGSRPLYTSIRIDVVKNARVTTPLRMLVRMLLHLQLCLSVFSKTAVTTLRAVCVSGAVYFVSCVSTIDAFCRVQGRMQLFVLEECKGYLVILHF